METKPKLLLVDDDDMILFVLLGFLKRNFEVTPARNATEALDRLRQQTFDLVLTDYCLPGMDGLQFSREARKIQPQSRVVLMSGYVHEESLKEALEEDRVDLFLPKPVPFKDLVAILKGVLDEKESESV